MEARIDTVGYAGGRGSAVQVGRGLDDLARGLVHIEDRGVGVEADGVEGVRFFHGDLGEGAKVTRL